MIAVDTSALVAIALKETHAEACAEALSASMRTIISAGTLAEAMIVGAGRGVADEVRRTIDGLEIEVIPVTEATARQVGEIYALWGKGLHSASLNFGDCFAYQIAREHNCPLLYVGDDFRRRTDVVSAL